MTKQTIWKRHGGKLVIAGHSVPMCWLRWDSSKGPFRYEQTTGMTRHEYKQARKATRKQRAKLHEVTA